MLSHLLSTMLRPPFIMLNLLFITEIHGVVIMVVGTMVTTGVVIMVVAVIMTVIVEATMVVMAVAIAVAIIEVIMAVDVAVAVTVAVVDEDKKKKYFTSGQNSYE